MKNPKLSEIRAREGEAADNPLSNVGYLLDLVKRLGKVLEGNRAQAHYFLCHGINEYPHHQDAGDCHSPHCQEARVLLKELEL